MESIIVNHEPSFKNEAIRIYGRMYLKSIREPNVFVVEGLKNKKKNLKFNNIDNNNKEYILKDCHYTEHDGHTHIECREWEIIYIDL